MHPPPATVIVNAIADVVGAEPCTRATVRVLDKLHEAGWGFARYGTLAVAAGFVEAMMERLGPDAAGALVTFRGQDRVLVEVDMNEWHAFFEQRRGGTDPRLPKRTA